MNRSWAVHSGLFPRRILWDEAFGPLAYVVARPVCVFALSVQLPAQTKGARVASYRRKNRLLRRGYVPAVALIGFLMMLAGAAFILSCYFLADHQSINKQYVLLGMLAVAVGVMLHYMYGRGQSLRRG